MTFPSVRSSTHSEVGSDTTTHTVSYPATVNAGDTLLCFFASDGSETVTFPNEGTEWHQLIELQNGAYNCTLAVAWKKAAGTEGGNTFTVTTGTIEQSAHLVWAIQDASDPTVSPPEVSTGATGAGSGATVDPDSLTAGGGSKEYLWIAVEGNDDDDAISVYPYADNNETHVSSSGSGECGIAICSDEVETDTQDPGTFTIAAWEEWCACTLCVYPVAGGGGLSVPVAMNHLNMHINHKVKGG